MKLGFKIRPLHLLAGAFCLPVLLFVGVLLWPQPRVSGLAIRFVGFTNWLGQPRCAVFGVTNVGCRTIDFVTAEPQVRTAGVWSVAAVAGPPWPTTVVLEGSQGTQVTAAAPNPAEAWRLPIIWC